MAESLCEQIADAIKTSLQGISGDGGETYWESPDAVVAVPWFEDVGQYALLGAGIGIDGPIYAIHIPSEEHGEKVTQNTDARMDVFILLLKRYELHDSAFQPGNPSRRTVVSRMVRDVLRKLLQDVQLLSVGGAVDNVFDEPVTVDRDKEVDGWAVAEIHLTVGYRYSGGVP